MYLHSGLRDGLEVNTTTCLWNIPISFKIICISTKSIDLIVNIVYFVPKKKGNVDSDLILYYCTYTAQVENHNP